MTDQAPDSAASRTRPSQAGITNRPPEHALVFALEIIVAEPRAVVERLRAVVEAELRSDLEDMIDAPEDAPPAETGELGFEDGFDRNHLTITVGFSLAGLTKLGLTAGEPNSAMPADLIDIPWDRLGDSAVRTRESGDMVIQACADSIYLVEHVLRRIESDLADSMRVVWVHGGTQRYTTRAGRTAREEGRALIGFLDGTSNLNPRHDLDHRRLVFVNPDDVGSYPPKQPPPGSSGYGQPAPPTFPDDLRDPPTSEPAWTRGGTYMVVRASANKIADWDRATLGSQQQTIGRGCVPIPG